MVEPQPFLSVIVPTRGRHHLLPGLFRSMTSQTLPVDRYELIVVDDGGPVGALEQTADAFRAALPLVSVRQDPQGPGAARNNGATRARGQHLVFTADDCQPAPDWLASIAQRLIVNRDTMVGGRVINGLPDDPFATTSSLLIDYLDRCRDSQAIYAPFFTPNNLAVPANLFADVGGFDASMGASGEDRDFCDRWLARGLPMLSAPEVIVRHYHPHTLRSFWQQHVSYGRGSRRFHRSRVGRESVPLRAGLTPEPLSFYWNLVWYPTSRSSGLRGWLHASLMVVSQAANLVGFVREGAGSGPAERRR